MSEYIISDEQIMSERRQAYEAGKRNREIWTARVYHGEEIVRCRDCERMREWTPDELDSYDEAEPADGWCMFFRIGTYDDFFCAWGEKR